MKITKNKSFRKSVSQAVMFYLVAIWGGLCYISALDIIWEHSIYALAIALIVFGYLCFYFGMYYGDSVYSKARYYWLRLRRIVNGRHKPTVNMMR